MNSFIFFKNLNLFIPILISISLFTLAERKLMSSFQRRKGPNIVGIFGILQPISDGIKLIFKENLLPQSSNSFFFLISPISTLFLSFLLWAILPLKLGIIIYDINLSLLFIFGISSLSIYGILYGGWSSNTKFSLLGSLRGISQLISYEVSIGFLFFSIFSFNSTFNLWDIFYNQIFIINLLPLFPIFLLIIISILAETNRTPFDLLEAESELVAGFLVEYSSLSFASFYLAEYSFLFFFSLLLSVLFFGSLPSSLFSFFFLFLFIWIRASLPRLRYDQLIHLGWMSILPLSITFFVFILSFLWSFDL